MTINRYHQTLSNAIYVFVGTLTYRGAALILLPIYTATLSISDYGHLELLVSVALLSIALLSLQVQEAFLSVFTEQKAPAAASAAAIIGAGAVVAGVAGLGLSRFTDFSVQISIALGSYVGSTLVWQFTRNLLRSLGKFPLAMRCELAQSVSMLLISATLLYGTGLGIAAALIGVAAGNCVATLVALLCARDMVRLTHPSNITRESLRAIARISSRLLPNVLVWWGIEMLDRLFLAYYHGEGAVATYAAGARLASILMAISLVIFQAWQIPAVATLERDERGAFFSNTFRSYYVLVLLCASILLCFSEALVEQLLGPDYLAAIGYFAALVPATIFSAFCYFFGIVYLMRNSRSYAFGTSIVGLMVSLGLNILLVPHWGPLGAAASSMAAFFTMCLIRYRLSRRALQLDLALATYAAPAVLVAGQCVGVYAGVSWHWLAAATVALLLSCRHDLRRLMCAARTAINGVHTV